MIPEAFLVCALSVPSLIFTRPPMFAKSAQDRLVDWIRKVSPGAEVFISANPDRQRLKDHFWEKIPFTWDGKEIWIQKKPKADQRAKKMIGAAA